jgi:hypothetical protein
MQRDRERRKENPDPSIAKEVPQTKTLRDRIEQLQRELHDERRKRRAAECEAYPLRASLHRLARLYRAVQPKPVATNGTRGAANEMSA